VASLLERGDVCGDGVVDLLDGDGVLDLLEDGEGVLVFLLDGDGDLDLLVGAVDLLDGAGVGGLLLDGGGVGGMIFDRRQRQRHTWMAAFFLLGDGLCGSGSDLISRRSGGD